MLGGRWGLAYTPGFRKEYLELFGENPPIVEITDALEGKGAGLPRAATIQPRAGARIRSRRRMESRRAKGGRRNRIRPHRCPVASSKSPAPP